MTARKLNVTDPWVLETEDPDAPTPALLWNGNIGIRFARNGSWHLPDGTSLPIFSQDSFEQGGEERIVPVPSQAVDPQDRVLVRSAQPSKYRQSLDMRTGLLSTTWEERDPGGVDVPILLETVLDPSGEPVLAERLTHITDVLATRTRRFGAQRASVSTKEEDFEAVKSKAEKYFADFWTTDIEIDGPAEDQQAIRSFLFYLRTAINPKNTRAISPMGLSSRQYFGHVFWDADVWVFPALALLDPERAATIPKYRLSKVEGARQNYLNWVKAGRPIGSGKSLGTAPADPNAIMFPWESSASGLETVPGDSRFQHHISGTVLFGLQHAAALGFVEKAKIDNVALGVAAFYNDRLTRGKGNDANLMGTMSPDENHTGDNDLYTNILANNALDHSYFRALQSDTRYVPRFVLPKDDKSFLTYDQDPIRSYKQAAAVLAIYPLQFPPAEKQANTMMERFEDKVIKNGPAMSDSVHATIWARLGEPDRAYSTWRKSWQDFTQHPLMMFSEKRSKDVTYFTTGAGGCLQTVLYGFAGLRIDDHKPSTAPWMIPIQNGYWLSCTPHLPKEWQSVKIKGLKVLGSTFDLQITGESVKVTKRP